MFLAHVENKKSPREDFNFLTWRSAYIIHRHLVGLLSHLLLMSLTHGKHCDIAHYT